MAKSYRNTLLSRTAAEFIEVGDRDGSAVAINARTNSVRKGGAEAKIVAGKVSYGKPILVANEGTGTVEFAGGFTLSFNVKHGDSATLAAYKAEVLRIFALAEADLAYGIVPGASTTFTIA